MLINGSNVLIGIFIFVWLVQMGYWVGLFIRMAWKFNPFLSGNTTNLTQPQPVSVIICARNEAANLAKFLPAVLQQNYAAGFEVVVVNDQSSDQTAAVLQEFAQQYLHLTVVNITEQRKDGGEAAASGKKQALAQGIAAAKHPILLFTDADCYPASNEWITLMTQALNKPAELVLGWSPYLKQSGWLNRLVRIETYIAGVQYLSWALAKKPYMGVGRNLCYTRTLYAQVGGFAGHGHLTSGDDDLLVQAVAKGQYAVSICINKKATCYTYAPTNFAAWWRQKTRHLSTSHQYTAKHKIFLGAFWTSQVLVSLLGLVGIYLAILGQNTNYLFLYLGLFFMRWVVQGIIHAGIKRNNNMDTQLVSWGFMVYDWLLTIYYLLLAPSVIWQKKQGHKWR